jgi:hypothetical protein
MPPSPLEPARAALSLRQSPIPALRRLRVEENDSAVIITGTVPSYYDKQLAQETLMPLLAGRRLHNRVEVVREPVEVPV